MFKYCFLIVYSVEYMSFVFGQWITFIKLLHLFSYQILMMLYSHKTGKFCVIFISIANLFYYLMHSVLYSSIIMYNYAMQFIA